MLTAEEILQLPKLEKLRVMELLWEDLVSAPDEIASPDWHSSVLAETEKRVADGKEVAVDWSAAKELLRNERA